MARAIHDVDCPNGPECEEIFGYGGRYARYAVAALTVMYDLTADLALEREELQDRINRAIAVLTGEQ